MVFEFINLAVIFCAFRVSLLNLHPLYRRKFSARIAQLVEHNLAKVGVAGSSPVSRSYDELVHTGSFLFGTCFAGMVELVDTQDLKSCGRLGRAGSSPAPGT